MQGKGFFLSIILVFFVLLLPACLTTGDRVNMDEFKRQLENGSQVLPDEQTQQAQVSSAETKTAEAQPQEAAVPAATAVTAAPIKQEIIKEQEQEIIPTAVVMKKTEPVAAKKEAAPVAATQPAGGYKWLLAAVFAAAFGIFALIAFIISRKKQVKEEEEVLPVPGVKVVEAVPEKAIEEYKETAALKPEPAKPAPEPAAPEEEPAQESKPEEPDNYSETTASVEPVPPLPPAVPLPEKQSDFGEGIAGISPTQFAAGSQGNAVHLLYKVGGDSPEYRTIKITVPEGWSKPGTVNTDEGYFIASLNGGRLISTAAENMSMIITVHGLPADRGEVAITFGERRGGSPGVKVQPQAGEAVFKIETEGRGTGELKEILDSPVVDVN